MDKKEFNKSKILKIVLITLVVVVIAVTLVLFGIGNYFVNYAILRTGGGGDREVKNSDAVNVQEITNESERIIEENRILEEEFSEKWLKDTVSEKVQVKANDGICLRGNIYFANVETNNWVIVLHGYHSSPDSVASIGRHFSEKDYNVLIPSMRASNESEGEFIGMGWLDKDDLKCWIDLILKKNPNANIVLHGSSMGASTVLMASGDKLPKNVKAIIADSGYTSVWDIFAQEAKARFNLPTFPILNMFQIVANIRANYDIKEASAYEQVKKATIPILFIHGDSDDFVPEYMCEKMYDVTKAPKEKFIVKGAGHTESRYKEPENYYNKIFEFLDKIEEL